MRMAITIGHWVTSIAAANIAAIHPSSCLAFRRGAIWVRGETSVTLCPVEDDNSLALEQHCVTDLRFERVSLFCSGVDDWSDLLRLIDRALPRGARAEVQCVLRLTLHGATPLAWRIARDLDRLPEEAHACAAGIDGLWIDKIELRLDGGAGIP